jgi:glycosyltransferase involved in cell wall biosynthesis
VENIPLGIDTRLRKQVYDLVEAGHDVTVISQADPANAEFAALPSVTVREYPPQPEPAGLPGYAREYGVSFAHAATAALLTRVRRPVDVVQFCQPPDIYFPLGWLLRLTGVRVVVDQRDLLLELFAARYGSVPSAMAYVLHWFERRSMRGADHVLCVNMWLRDRLTAAGIPPSRVTILYNGPVLARMTQASPVPELVREAGGLVCWVGKMGRQDRVDLVLDLAEQLVREHGRDGCRFVLLGDGECLEELRAATSERHLDRWVSFPGWLPENEVFDYLASADLGIDASLQAEVTPVKVLEYMAAGLPVVAFDLPETRAVARGAGVLVPPGDVAAAAKAVAELLDDSQRRLALGAEGRRRVSAELSWERQREAYLRVIGALARAD